MLMTFRGFAICLFTGMVMLALAPGAKAQSVQRVVATVNDQPITAYELSQRIKFVASTSKARQSKALSQKVLQILVNEKLQMQAAQQLNIAISDEQLSTAMKGIGKKNKFNVAALKKFLASRGVRIKTLENKIRTELAWSEVVRRKFKHLVSVGTSDINIEMEKAGESAEKKVENKTIFELQKLLLKFSQGRTERELKDRMAEAETLRAAFRTCRRWKAIARKYRNIKATHTASIEAGAIKEPLRSVLMKTEAGQVTPSTTIPGGIEIVAVCNRKEETSKGGKRQAVASLLRNQQFNQFAQRHLRDLRRDAVIEYSGQGGSKKAPPLKK